MNCINLQNQLDEISTFKNADKTAEKTLQSTHTFEQKIDLQSNKLKLRAGPSLKSRVLIVLEFSTEGSCHVTFFGGKYDECDLKRWWFHVLFFLGELNFLPWVFSMVTNISRWFVLVLDF